MIRAATAGDVGPVADAIGALLLELGGGLPDRGVVEAEVRALLDDPAAGLLLVAESEGEIVGMLGASWQRAIHVPGPYALIQDLWVEQEWRSRGVGAELIDAIVAAAQERGMPRVEVGLPKETFAAIAATERFYAANGFEHLGPRMRRLVA